MKALLNYNLVFICVVQFIKHKSYYGFPSQPQKLYSEIMLCKFEYNIFNNIIVIGTLKYKWQWLSLSKYNIY